MTSRGQLVAAESEPSHFLPFARHVNDRMLRTDNGELLAIFRIGGISFQTLDIWQINDWHEKFNIALRMIADERIALHSYVVRQIETGYPTGVFRSGFAKELDTQYRASLRGKRMFTNTLYLAVIQRPTAGAVDWIASQLGKLFTTKTTERESEAEEVARLDSVLSDLAKALDAAQPTLLRCYEGANGLMFSEVLEFLSTVMTGGRRKLPLVRGHLGAALYQDRLIFGAESIEIREVGGTRFAGVLGTREHSASTFPGMLNNLLTVDFEFVLGQSFAFYGRPKGLETAKRKFGQMNAADDVAVSQAEALRQAMDGLQSGEFVVGEHSLALTVFAPSLKRLNECMSVARANLGESGLVAAREDLGLVAAYWSQLPGNFKWRTRPATISSRNLASLAPLHTFPTGSPRGNHWGEAVCLLKTTSRSPFFFNFHVADVGHTLIIGPTGGGKTVLQNFLLAQTEKFNARQIFIDKDRGAELYVRASGGTYLPLQNGKATGFAPLRALEHDPGNRTFLLEWLRLLVSPPGAQLSSSELDHLDRALAAVSKLPLEDRSLASIRSMLPHKSQDDIGARLDRWVSGGELGWVFDNPRDELAIDAQFFGVDMTAFLDNDAIRPALMAYIFHRIDLSIDGRPTVVDIDEFWKALGDSHFKAFVHDGLKTWRKRNAMLVFGTQSPADALRSDISHTIMEQCATKILLPNAAARERDYVEGLNLSKSEFALIKTSLTPASRSFLVKQGHGSVVAQLDLSGMDDALAILSGRASTVELLDQLRAELGDDPAKWLPEFHKRRAGLR